MKNRYCIAFALVLSTCFATDSFSAEIKWNLYLGPAMSQGPVLSGTTREGQEFAFSEYVLQSSQTQYRSILDDLEGTTFLLQKSPSTQTIEIRINQNLHHRDSVRRIFCENLHTLTFNFLVFSTLLPSIQSKTLTFPFGLIFT